MNVFLWLLVAIVFIKLIPSLFVTSWDVILEWVLLLLVIGVGWEMLKVLVDGAKSIKTSIALNKYNRDHPKLAKDKNFQKILNSVARKNENWSPEDIIEEALKQYKKTPKK